MSHDEHIKAHNKFWNDIGTQTLQIIQDHINSTRAVFLRHFANKNTLPPRFKSFTGLAKSKQLVDKGEFFLYYTKKSTYELDKEFLKQKVEEEKFNKTFKELIK